MTDDDITRLRTLAQAATPGPWAVERSTARHDSRVLVKASAPSQALARIGGDSLRAIESDALAAYIAAVSPDVVLALIAERGALAALLARVVDEYDGDYSLTKRLMHEIRTALAAKEPK